MSTMIKMDAGAAISDIVEAFLPRFSPDDLGFIVALDMRDDDHDREIYCATTAVALFHRNSNYTKVLGKYSFDNGFVAWSDIEGRDTYFGLHCDHDSAWYTDGLKFLNEHWKNVESFFEKRQMQLSQHISFSSFFRMGFVRIEKMEPVYNHSKMRDWVEGYTMRLSEWNSKTS